MINNIYCLLHSLNRPLSIFNFDALYIQLQTSDFLIRFYALSTIKPRDYS